MIVHLRKLTKKSIIGFGKWTDLSVQNLINMNNHKALIWIYYNCSNLTFTDMLLAELHITGDEK